MNLRDIRKGIRDKVLVVFYQEMVKQLAIRD